MGIVKAIAETAVEIKPAKPCVLIVDDMMAIRMILRGMLEDLGFTDFIEAEDGEIAWDLIRERSAESEASPIGLIIADWNMPGMSGGDLLRAVRSFPPTSRVPFFIATGEGTVGHLTQAFQAGVTDFFVKPFQATDLGLKIQTALGQ